jgi:hypothetical protein
MPGDRRSRRSRIFTVRTSTGPIPVWLFGWVVTVPHDALPALMLDANTLILKNFGKCDEADH